MKTFKYLGSLLTNQNSIEKEIKLLIETKSHNLCLGKIFLRYNISREKFEPEPGFESRTPAPPGKSGIRLKREI